MAAAERGCDSAVSTSAERTKTIPDASLDKCAEDTARHDASAGLTRCDEGVAATPDMHRNKMLLRTLLPLTQIGVQLCILLSTHRLLAHGAVDITGCEVAEK